MNQNEWKNSDFVLLRFVQNMKYLKKLSDSSLYKTHKDCKDTHTHTHLHTPVSHLSVYLQWPWPEVPRARWRRWYRWGRWRPPASCNPGWGTERRRSHRGRRPRLWWCGWSARSPLRWVSEEQKKMFGSIVDYLLLTDTRMVATVVTEVKGPEFTFSDVHVSWPRTLPKHN